MVLEELIRQYDRLQEAGTEELPPVGFSREKIHFVLRIDREGRAIATIPLGGEDRAGKRIDYQERNVPKYTDRTSGVFPFFLWDKTAYVLGVDPNARPTRLQEQFAAFKKLHHDIGGGLEDPEMSAVLAFLDGWTPEQVERVQGLSDLIGGNLFLEVEGFNRPVFENPLIRRAWLAHVQQQLGDATGICLATGEETVIARTHPSIRGVWGSQTSGAAIVSFNDDAYLSYGKAQSYNAPVGAEAAGKYTKMLNYLLRRDSQNVVRIADASILFWCEKPSILEGTMQSLMARRDDTITDAAIDAFLTAVRKGTSPPDFDPDRRFFVLGLAAPSKSRLSLRYWYQGTTGELAERLRQHLADTEIVSMWEDDPTYPSIWHYLTSVVLRGDAGNIKPRMHEALARAILFGTPYPRRLYVAALERIRVGDRRRRAFDTWRTGLIRGYLRRHYWDHEKRQPTKEVPVALNPDVEDAAYQLGRLFAVYEQIQVASVGNRSLNRTIKDRFYTAAATNPRRSFAVLDKLSTAHQKKLKPQLGGFFRKLLEEIMDHIDAGHYPTALSLEEQGLFALGYHHQRKDLFTKKEA